jgi:glucoamylase
LDQEAFAILLAWMTGLTDNATYRKIKMTADHLQGAGPDTTERWEELKGQSPSSIAAEIAGLVAAADIARQNGDATSAASWESKTDSWRLNLAAWTYTTSGFWGGHQYYERIDETMNPNDTNDRLCFQEGCFYVHDVVDFGFLDLVRLGVQMPTDTSVATSLAPTAAAFDGNSTVQVTMTNGDIYFHRYNHDNYGESNTDCSGWPTQGANRYGRLWPVLSGERGEYELANGHSASVYLQSMADATNDGYFTPEQIWDRPSISCFALGRATGSASPLNWAEGQYLRLSQSIDAGYNLDTRRWLRRSTAAPGRSWARAANASTTPVPAQTMAPRSRSGHATLPARRVGHGAAVTGRYVFWTNVSMSLAAPPSTGR